MHTILTSLFILLSLALTILATDIDANDLPSQCQDVCRPVVSLTASCDAKTSDDNVESDCVCKGRDMNSILPRCEACIAQNSKDGHDNDANDLVKFCSFSTTTYHVSATGSSGGTTSTGASTHASMTGNTQGPSSVTGSPTTSSASTSGSTSSSSSSAAGPVVDSPGGFMNILVLGVLGLGL